MSARDAAVALHEAAHVVVGVALGLRMRRAVLKERALGGGWFELGQVLFEGKPQGPHREALALMYAAGIAWDRRHGEEDLERGDIELLRELSSGPHAVRTYIRAADSMIYTRSRTHRRVARALLERDLTGKDITALARGERLDSE